MNKRIAIYNQNCSGVAGSRAWNVSEDDDNGDVTWYDESDLSWARKLSIGKAANSNELHMAKVASVICAEFDPDSITA